MATWDMSGIETWELSLDDPRYPDALKAGVRPPEVLYGAGDVTVFGSSVAVVGARKATPYGLHCADLFAGFLARRGIVVVSGGAIGCDQAAHRAALDSDGKTIAVLGSGVDVCYPARATKLLREIALNGAVVSERPWGHPPVRWAFRERNRIIAGLSTATLIVEAGLPSGTFSTAEFALDAGRSVLAVPGSILAPESRGSNRLIVDGAMPIVDEETLASAIDLLFVGEEDGTTDDIALISDDPLLVALRADPLRPDDLARAFSLDIVEVLRTLSRYEFEGVVRHLPDGRFAITPKRR